MNTLLQLKTISIGFTKFAIFYYYVFMYEQKTRNTGNIKIFGIKLFEMERLDTEVFEREFISEDDTQAILGSYSSVTYKFFGIPVIQFNAKSKPEDERAKTE